MSNSEKWVTDRVPDAYEADPDGMVWVTVNGKTELMEWDDVTDEPWQPIDVPLPYKKPEPMQWYVNSDNPDKLVVQRHGRDEDGSIVTERIIMPKGATIKHAERTAKLWNRLALRLPTY